ncbi:MAG TPA: type II CAAX endopeptidase family protein [Candidatus Limnocylindria bacterium]|nr:type II CAAX endopeptidase family protein [Candidatus Limnocylindria bacterium]
MPLSPTPSTLEGFSWRRSLALAGSLLVALIAGVLLAVILARAAHASLGDPRHPTLTWGIVGGQILLYVPVIATLMAYLPWVARRSLSDLGLRRPGARELSWGLGGGLAMLVVTLVVGGIQYAVLHLKTQQLPVQLLANAHDPSVIAGFAALAIVIAPFCEEFVFRGFVFNAIHRYAPLGVAMALSGALFALAHADLTAFLPLCGGGIVLAWVYARSGSLVSSMIAHGTFNAVQVMLIVFAHQT